MRIGIDARLINETGVGRYIRNVIAELGKNGGGHEYIAYLPPGVSVDLPAGWIKKTVGIRWHTLSEQLVLPFVYLADKLDLLHVPYFTVPVFYPKKLVTTIHDVTILHERTGKATTLPYPLYLMRWLGYAFVLWAGAARARHIITVSETTKQEIMELLRVPKEKITVTYEGVNIAAPTPNRSPVAFPYFLYVGNVYPHKNAELLLEALAFGKKHEDFLQQEKLKLVFVGKRDYFYDRLIKRVQELDLSSMVHIVHTVDDPLLSAYYQHARGLVFPSKREGFGLPALEALSFDRPILVSDLPVFHEIVSTPLTQFIPLEAPLWYAAIKSVYTKRTDQTIWKQQKEQFFSRYSWKQLAAKTRRIYETV